MSLIQEIKTRRAKRNLTASELSAMVGVPASTITRAEKGERSPSVEIIDRIANATGGIATILEATKHVNKIDQNLIDILSEDQHTTKQALCDLNGIISGIIETECILDGWNPDFHDILDLLSGRNIEITPTTAYISKVVNVVQSYIQDIRNETEIRLIYAIGNSIVTPNEKLEVPERALTFLADCIASGAEGFEPRVLVGAYLTQHGYPWLTVPSWEIDNFDEAVVKTRMGDANEIAAILIESIPPTWVGDYE